MTTIRWRQDVSGDWGSSFNWDLFRLPNSNDDVAINTSALHTVTHSTGTDFAHTLSVGAGVFAVSGGSLTIKSTSSFANRLTVSGGSMTLGGAAAAANFTQSHGTVSGAGTLTVTGAASFTGSLLQTGGGATVLKGASTTSGAGSQLGLDGGRTLENQGTLTLTGSTQLLLGFNPFGTSLGGGALKNDAGATLDLQGSGLAIGRFTGATSFTNAGTLEKTAGTGVATIGVAVGNTGSILVETGTLDIDGALTNSGAGTIRVFSGARLNLFGGGSAAAGAFRVEPFATLDFTGGTFSLGGGTLLGDVEVEAGVLSIAGAVTIQGAFVDSSPGSTSLASGSVLVLPGGGSAKASNLTLAAGSTLVLEQIAFSLGAGTVGGTGTVSVNAGELKVAGATAIPGLFEDNGVISGAGTLTVSGPAEFQGGELHTGAGLTVLEGASLLNGGNFNLDGGRVLENKGAFTLASGKIHLGHNPFGTALGGGTLRNDAGATFDIQNATTLARGAGTTLIENAGLFEQTVTAGVTRVEVDFDDTGAILAHSGTLDFIRAITGDGTMAVDAGATLEVDRSAAASLGMSFNGAGATLALGKPAKFAATISGFAAGDTIDLLGTQATRATLKSGDRLAIFNGADKVATLQLAGDYTGASFAVGSDGAGGSSITVTTLGSVPGHRFIAAMAGFGGAGGGPLEATGPMHPGAWRPTLGAPGRSHFA